jgi:Fe-Mn family superoxide dismutase
MEIHHQKHHGGYTTKLNAAIEGTDLAGKSIEQILAVGVDKLPTGVRNNGGGYYNHNLFWTIMTPGGAALPDGSLKQAIDRDLGGFEKMKEDFGAAAAGRFGSGWAWICVKDGKLNICDTANQDNPLMGAGHGGTPILGLDVWEHAYYLNYQNRRPDYISAWWNVVNWPQVQKNLDAAK